MSEQTVSQTEAYKASLNEIVAGDVVVVRRPTTWGPSYRLATVERTTRTQIIVGKEFPRPYHKQGGGAVKKDERSEIFAPAQTSYIDRESKLPVTALEEMQAHEAAKAAKRDRNINIARVRDNVEKFSTEQLAQLVAMLDANEAAAAVRFAAWTAENEQRAAAGL